ncbi:hypothetical protein [Bacillus swezeyi]|uniref:hypothetical protein n=1 Tax=Bacillus swezeyi TaxID=1925020 RepID=UPI00399C96CB
MGAYPSDEQDFQQFIQTYLPKGVGRFSKGGVCLYTKYPMHKREIIANWPKARQGYHVILAVRDMADNKNAFYQSIDIQLVNP